MFVVCEFILFFFFRSECAHTRKRDHSHASFRTTVAYRHSYFLMQMRGDKMKEKTESL